MSCPHCGDARTEVLKTIHRGRSLYRTAVFLLQDTFQHTRAIYILEPLEPEVARARPSRNGWKKHRAAAVRGKCEVESCGVDFKQTGVRRHVDHIVPARLIRRLRAGNLDHRGNLQCICGTCHGYKLQADHKLCLGDKLAYLEILRIHQFDIARVERAPSLYGL